MSGKGVPKFRHTVIDPSPIGTRHTVCLVGDLNGDGFEDVIIGNYVIDGSSEGTLAWYEYPNWTSFNGDGHDDIFVGEMGLGRNPHPPKLLIYMNDGNGAFEEFLVDSGHPTHEAKLIDVGKTGKPSIVGKPFHPGNQVDLWENVGPE